MPCTALRKWVSALLGIQPDRPCLIEFSKGRVNTVGLQGGGRRQANLELDPGFLAFAKYHALVSLLPPRRGIVSGGNEAVPLVWVDLGGKRGGGEVVLLERYSKVSQSEPDQVAKMRVKLRL